MIAVIILYAVLASVFPLTKASLQYVQPVFLVGVRMIVGGVLLLVFSIFIIVNYLPVVESTFGL